MPNFLIERTVPGAGNMSPAELHKISAKSNSVLAELGPNVQWVHSYVTDDKIFCVYRTTDESLIHEHARCGGFPVDSVMQIAAVIDPTTGEG